MNLNHIKLYGDFRAYAEALDASGLNIDFLKKYAKKLSGVLEQIKRIPQNERTTLGITEDIFERKTSLCNKILDGSYFIR